MHINMFDVGRKSMSMLDELLEEEQKGRSVKFESTYVKRDTTTM